MRTHWEESSGRAGVEDRRDSGVTDAGGVGGGKGFRAPWLTALTHYVKKGAASTESEGVVAAGKWWEGRPGSLRAAEYRKQLFHLPVS